MRFVFPFIILVLVGLSGCARELPPTNYYVLGLPITPAAQQEADFPVSLAVGRFEAEPVLLRRSIVWRTENKIGYYTYEKWAELPARMFSYRLYRRAAASRLFERVEMQPAAAETDLVLDGTVLAFEEVATPHGKVGRVRIEVDLSDSDDTLLWNGTITKEEPAEGEDAEAVVDAITQAAEKAISEILASVEDALRQAETEEAAEP